MGDRSGLHKIFATALAAYLFCGALTLFATGVLIAVAPLFFKVPAAQLGTIRWTLLILGINQALAFGVALRDALVFGSGRMFVTSSINMVVNLAITLGFIAMALAGRGTVGMALVMLGRDAGQSGVVSAFAVGRFLAHEAAPCPRQPPDSDTAAEHRAQSVRDIAVGRDHFWRQQFDSGAVTHADGAGLLRIIGAADEFHRADFDQVFGGLVAGLRASARGER